MTRAASAIPDPIAFERNRGQSDPQVEFLARSKDRTLFLTATEARLVGTRSARLSAHGGLAAPRLDSGSLPVFRMRLAGANPSPRIGGLGEASRVSYLVGRDRSRWRTDVPAFAAVRYDEVYPGVSIVYYGTPDGLEYDLVVAPGADPGKMELDLTAGRVELDDRGDLVLRSGAETVRLRRPQVYQEIGSSRRTVPCRYALVRSPGRPHGEEAVRVRFLLADFDNTRRLVVDPVLTYSTYLGAAGDDEGNGIAVDAAGNTYVSGSMFLPAVTAPGASRAPSTGVIHAFVAKFSATGSLIYRTYIGGEEADTAQGVALDAAGNVHVAGATASREFPVANALFPALSGAVDAFVAKLAPDGSTLLYSTYLGGRMNDVAYGVAVDPAGSAYVAGSTASSDFPTAAAFQGINRGSVDAFAAKLSPAGDRLIYSTYLGGSGSESVVRPSPPPVIRIAVDASGCAYLTGDTDSYDFPVTPGAFQTRMAGVLDLFVAKLDPTGSSLSYATYVGGSSADFVGGIAVDASGNAFVAGSTHSDDFPTRHAAFGTHHPGRDGFVLKLDRTGSDLVYSTYLGGTGGDTCRGIALDGAGGVFLTGGTKSNDFPVAGSTATVFTDPVKTAYDVFVAKLNRLGAAFVYTTVFGGSDNDAGLGIAVDAAGGAHVAGITSSPDLPTTHAVQPSYGGGDSDALLSRVDPVAEPEITVRLETDAGRTLLTVAVANRSASAVAAELKLWVSSSGIANRSMIDGSPLVVTLPPDTTTEIVKQAPLPFAFPGTTISGRLLDPASGSIWSESTCLKAPCH